MSGGREQNRDLEQVRADYVGTPMKQLILPIGKAMPRAVPERYWTFCVGTCSKSSY
jgi:hypothetical protein